MVAPAESTATPEQQPLPLDTPVDWHERLHGAQQRGTVVLWHPRQRPAHSKIEPDHPIGQILQQQAGQNDVFATPCEFYGWRLVRLLKRLRACYVDVDQPDTDPMVLFETCMSRLEHARIPPPTFVVHSGGGLHLYWVLETPVSEKALPYWQAIQRYLREALAGDRKASDAARALRIPGTRNAKRGGVEARGQIVSDELWTLDDLGREVLPLSRAECRDIRAESARRERRPPATTRGIASWWYRVYRDIIRIQEHWWFGGVAEGHRDEMLFLSSVALSYFTQASTLKAEIASTARTLTPTLTTAQVRTYTQTVVQRALLEAQEVDAEGHPRDPSKHRYWMKRTTLRERLHDLILPEIEPELTGLASDEVLAERHAERQQQRRRDAGAIPRDEYESGSAERQRPWEDLGISRRAYYYRKKKGQI